MEKETVKNQKKRREAKPSVHSASTCYVKFNQARNAAGCFLRIDQCETERKRDLFKQKVEERNIELSGYGDRGAGKWRGMKTPQTGLERRRKKKEEEAPCSYISFTSLVVLFVLPDRVQTGLKKISRDIMLMTRFLFVCSFSI